MKQKKKEKKEKRGTAQWGEFFKLPFTIIPMSTIDMDFDRSNYLFVSGELFSSLFWVKSVTPTAFDLAL